MHDATSPRCPGTIVVHRDMALSCTSDPCRGDLPHAMWLQLHAGFVHCVDAIGGSGCAQCGFRVPPRPHPVSRVQARPVGAGEITSIEWCQRDQRILLHYDVGEPDSLLATIEVAAGLAAEAGMDVSSGDDATVRWVRRADAGTPRRRPPSTG